MESAKRNNIKLIYLGLILYSTVLMLFCTKSSPLYVFNDWYDANAYFTVGKGLMNGVVPYRDLFDHKGPLLYFLYGIGYLIDNTGFMGIFMLQTIAMALQIIFSYKIAKLYVNKDIPAVIIGLLAPFFTLSNGIYVTTLDFGGGGPEDFILTLIIIGLYLIIKYYLSFEGHYDKSILKLLFPLGIIGGCIFMMKFTLAFCVFGCSLLILFHLLMKRQFKLAFTGVLVTGLGLLVIVLPYFIYAYITHSGSEFIESYIKFNFQYGTNENMGLLYSIANALSISVSFLMDRIVLGILITLGIIYMTFLERKHTLILRVMILLSFILLILPANMKQFAYSSIPTTLYCIFGYIAVAKWICKYQSDGVVHSEYQKPVLTALAVLIAFSITVGNNKLILSPLSKIYKNEDLKTCQAKVADIILADKKENHTLMEISALDGGFYTASGIIPTSRYFYVPNTDNKEFLQKIYDSRLADVKSDRNAYILIGSEKADIDKNDPLMNAVLNDYELIEVINGTALQRGRNYMLYRLRDKNAP